MIPWPCRTMGFEKSVIMRSTQGRMIMAPALAITGADRYDRMDKVRLAVDRETREHARL
ncbi:hypothetical protein N5D61_04275 [Pseudomonas sp. GD03842]|uniref:hypothetical protein n=1 Tax=Pseudomonas sp. GD03842 TaxID=2975385 RepID=UPI002449C577|nr:hypothetical protein [Pseudomonas sp. GD03842]MDH0745563.1 hypothetical protein [Pseudomonas sp. GD03842]